MNAYKTKSFLHGQVLCEFFVGTYEDPIRLTEAELNANYKHAVTLLFIHLNIFVYACTFWMQQPILPSLSTNLGADSVTFGTLSSVISMFGLIGGPLMGRIVDTQGAKAGLLVSQGGSILMYGLMGISYSLPILFLSRVPAIAQHAMLCAQAAVSKLTTTNQRAKALGRLSLSYAIGMVVGSPLGGTISKYYGDHLTCVSACVMCVLVVVLNIVFLPTLEKDNVHEDIKSEDKTPHEFLSPSSYDKGKESTEEAIGSTSNENSTDEKRKADIAGSNLVAIVEVLRVDKVFSLLMFSFLVSLGTGVYSTMFSLIATDYFHLDPQSLGMLMSIAGLLSVMANVGVVGILTDNLGDFKTMVLSSCVLAVGVPCICLYATSVNELIVLTAPTTISSTVVYTVLGSMLSTSVHDDQTGTAISLSHAIRSLCGIIAPLVGGFVIREFNVGTLGLTTGVLIVVAIVYLWLHARESLDREYTAGKVGKKLAGPIRIVYFHSVCYPVS
eukprot:CFRG4804T1